MKEKFWLFVFLFCGLSSMAFGQAIQATPEYQQASQLLSQNNYDGAISALQNLLTVPTYAVEAKLEIGNIRKRQAEGEFALAISHFSEAAANILDVIKAGGLKGSEGAKTLLELGLIYEDRLADYAKAAEVYSQILQGYPSFLSLDKVVFHLANCYEKLGKISEAANAYREIVLKHPYSTYFPIAQNRMKILSPGTKEAQAAIEAQETLVEGAKTDLQAAKASMDLAAMYAKEGDFKKAIQEYRKVAAEAPTPELAREAYQKMATLMDEKEKDYSGAAAALEEMVHRFPNDPGNEKSLMRLGKIYEQNMDDLKVRIRDDRVLYKKDTGNIEKAINYYNQITESGGDADIVAEAFLRKGELYEKQLKDPDEAKRQYEEFLKRFPDHQEAEKVREKLKKLNE